MRVLLAENDLHTGQSLFCVLRDAEYTVDWVRDGRAASLAIAASYYAVVLLNLSLPGIGGIALLKASRAAGNKVPVVLLSAHDDPETHARGPAANDWLCDFENRRRISWSRSREAHHSSEWSRVVALGA